MRVLAESAALFGESGAKRKMLKSIVHIRVRRFNTNTGRIENNFESLWMFSLNFCFTKNRKPNQFVHETPEQTRVQLTSSFLIPKQECTEFVPYQCAGFVQQPRNKERVQVNNGQQLVDLLLCKKKSIFHELVVRNVPNRSSSYE